MFTRTTGFFIVPLWLAAMSWVVARDIWPTLTALPAPPLQVNDWLRTDGLRSHYLISDDVGRVGEAWSEYLIDEQAIRRDDVIWLERLPALSPPARITVASVYTGAGELDEITIRAENRDAEMRLHGERFHADFAFELTSGPINKAFKIPLSEGRMITGAFHPFSALTHLRVGQRWHMQVVNPIASLTGFGSRFVPLLVEVTGEERIAIGGGHRNCLVVESQRTKAWVDAQGAVLVQELTLPMFGTLRLVRDSEFNEDGRSLARAVVFSK